MEDTHRPTWLATRLPRLLLLALVGLAGIGWLLADHPWLCLGSTLGILGWRILED